MCERLFRLPFAALCAALLATALAAQPVAAQPSPAQPAPPEPPAHHAPAEAPPEFAPESVPGRLLVTLVEASADADAELHAEVRRLGGAVTTLTESIRLARVPVTRVDEAAGALRRLGGVRAVEPDRMRAWARLPNDAMYPKQWSHSLSDAPGAWDHTIGNHRVRVALIDSGVRGDHPELAPNIAEQVDLSNSTPVARGKGVDNDSCEIGHGTQVAGILGAVGDNAMGVAGVAWRVSILDLAVSSMATPGTCEGASDSAILAALHYATYNPGGAVDVVNLSVGGRQAYCPEAYERAIAEAREQGVVVVAASGNSGPETAQVPASCPGVIAVGAVDASGAAADYSAANPWVDLSAPGGDSAQDGARLLTTSRRGDWTSVRGTSFAAPYVAGVAALLRSVDPGLTPDQVESVLERTAKDDGQDRDDARGWGRVQAGRAVSWVRRGVDIPPPEPEPRFPVLRLQPLPAGPGPVRIGADGPTDPLLEAVELSRAAFREGGAVHAVIARVDNFADALAGSALGMGVGPLLFTEPGESLTSQVRRELRRALPAGSRVYVLGGERGLGRGVADDLRGMGYGVARLAGPSREETAVQVAREIARIRRRSGMPPLQEVILATRSDWPDAVGAGVLASRWALPVLLTGTDSLHAATSEALAELQPSIVTVVGSAGRISDRTALHAQHVAGAEHMNRLAGASRYGTMAEVSREALRRLGSARVAMALNVERDAAYTHALAASVFAGAYGGVFVPMRGRRGEQISEPGALMLDEVLQHRANPTDLLGVVIGGEDVISASGARQFEQRLHRQ